MEMGMHKSSLMGKIDSFNKHLDGKKLTKHHHHHHNGLISSSSYHQDYLQCLEDLEENFSNLGVGKKALLKIATSNKPIQPKINNLFSDSPSHQVAEQAPQKSSNFSSLMNSIQDGFAKPNTSSTLGFQKGLIKQLPPISKAP